MSGVQNDNLSKNLEDLRKVLAKKTLVELILLSGQRLVNASRSLAMEDTVTESEANKEQRNTVNTRLDFFLAQLKVLQRRIPEIKSYMQSDLQLRDAKLNAIIKNNKDPKNASKHFIVVELTHQTCYAIASGFDAFESG